MLEKPALYLLGQYGALAMGWVLAAVLLALIVLLIRWFLKEQAEWRKVSEARSEAYHTAIVENSLTMTKQAVVFEERTSEIVDYIRKVRR